MNYRIRDLGSPSFNFSMMNREETRTITDEDKEILLKNNLVWYNDDLESQWQKKNKDMLCCDSDIVGDIIYNYLDNGVIDMSLKKQFKPLYFVGMTDEQWRELFILTIEQIKKQKELHNEN